MSDKDYENDWLAYWESFSKYLLANRSRLGCVPRRKRAFELAPAGKASHITVRCLINKRRVVTELTLKGPKELSNANYDRVRAKYEAAYPELDWNKAASDSESHIRSVDLGANPQLASDRNHQHKRMMAQSEVFLDWIGEFDL